MKKFFALLLSTIFMIWIFNVSLNVSAKEEESTATTDRSEVLDYLEDSSIKQFANTPEGKAAYENVKNNAVKVSKSDTYVRFDTLNQDNEPISFDEKQYNEQLVNQKMRRSMSSNSGNRYSWIKLTVEAYGFNDGSYMFCGFFNWLTKPFFTGNDVIALGHDSSIVFNTDSTFGYYQCEYMTSASGKTDLSFYHFDFAQDKTNTTATTTGVGAKFKLQHTQDSYPAVHSGAIYCNGWLNASKGNLQVSYGHSQLSINTSISASITWLPSGAIKFDVRGDQDMATHGNYVD